MEVESKKDRVMFWFRPNTYRLSWSLVDFETENSANVPTSPVSLPFAVVNCERNSYFGNEIATWGSYFPVSITSFDDPLL